MSNNGKGNTDTSWVVVVLLLFIFWPVGLYLLVKKLTADKTAAISSGGKGLKVTGIFLIVVAALAFLGFLTSAAEQGISSGDIGGIIVLLFFISGGVTLLRKAKKLKIESENIKKYLAIVVNGNVRQIDAIAATTGKSYNVVYKDIKNMIDKGYLNNAYIDESKREVVMPSDALARQNAVIAPTNEAAAKSKIVSCPCCGAKNTIHGNAGECEYCGSPLK